MPGGRHFLNTLCVLFYFLVVEPSLYLTVGKASSVAETAGRA